MFSQILEPAAQNLGLTILAALVPLIVLLFLPAVVRMTAWLATIIASIVTIVMGVLVWSAPAGLALNLTCTAQPKEYGRLTGSSSGV